MSTSLPVLISIKSDWSPIENQPLVGKDVLELLSSAMYIDPLSIYREYVQNAADSIDLASAQGLLGGNGKGRVAIAINSHERKIRIRDNGTGLAKGDFVDTLISLGASKKRGSKARGFRGVGRLGGLGYCQELIFRSRTEEDVEVSELRWDCRRLRAVLRELSPGANVEHVIKDVVRTRRLAAQDYPRRFFEVELSGILRHGNDRLINVEQVSDYLSQIAPVPFSPDFRFAKDIEELLRPYFPGNSLNNVLIYINESDKELFRPHRDKFEARKGVSDAFNDIQPIKIQDGDQIAAIGWILHHGYLGSIDNSASVKGLRLRTGNMQVGESNLLDDLFMEPRFNAWSVGEIHVFDPRIVPNGRRDHFEQNTQFLDLLNKLTPTARELSRRCRVSSLRRNTIRQFEISYSQVFENIAAIRQGALGPSEKKRFEKDARKQLKRMEKCCSHSALQQHEKSKFQTKLKRLQSRLEKVANLKPSSRAPKKLQTSEEKALYKIVSLIYECSPNKAAARQLIDRILKRL